MKLKVKTNEKYETNGGDTMIVLTPGQVRIAKAALGDATTEVIESDLGTLIIFDDQLDGNHAVKLIAE